jgi:chemotaxis protein CheX
LDSAAESQPVLNESREALLQSFVSATRDTLREMANTEAVVRSIDHNPPGSPSAAGITAVISLGSATQGYLLLNFSEETATAVARRVLAGVTNDSSETIVADCLGEVANVVAGQAKALLAETPFRVTLSIPKVVTDPTAERDLSRGLHCQSVVFDTELGAFTLHLLSAIS